jgi:hypothetical protein
MNEWMNDIVSKKERKKQLGGLRKT